MLQIEKDTLKRTVMEDEQNENKRILHLTTYLSSGWRTSRFLIRMMLNAHEDWHWLRSEAVEIPRIPKSITANEISTALYEAGKREPSARENLKISEVSAAEAEEKVKIKEIALKDLCGQLKEHYKEYVDPALGPWDSTNNIKRWDKKDKAHKKEFEVALKKAIVARDKAAAIFSKRKNEVRSEEALRTKPAII